MLEETPLPDSEEQDEQELFEHHRIICEKGQTLIRIDKFLCSRIEHVSRNQIQNAADSDCVVVNGKPVKPSYKVKPRDVITVLMTKPVREIELIAEDIPVKIIYEDEDVCVVDKQAGMVVHPAFGNYSGTLVNAMLFHFNKNSENKFSLANGGTVRPGLVHRIDKNTSGLLVIAKNEKSLTILAKAFYDRKVKRNYSALVWGDFKEETGTITGNIGRNIRDRKIMQVFPEGEAGKHAVTHYKVLERFRYVTLIDCKLETGRTHQIRVHLKYIGHPIFSDDTYGGDKILKGTTFTKYKQFVENCFRIIPRQALHARTLGFIHPVSKKELFFESPLPNDFSNVLEKWRGYSEEKN